MAVLRRISTSAGGGGGGGGGGEQTPLMPMPVKLFLGGGVFRQGKCYVLAQTQGYHLVNI